MPDSINSGCSRMPPINISANPPVNSMEEMNVYGCAPKSTPPPAMTVTKTKAKAQQLFRQLGLSSATRSSLLTAMGLTGSGGRAAGVTAKTGMAMLESLKQAVRANPKLASKERNQFANQWIGLGKRAGAQDAFTALSKSRQFWTRLHPRHRQTVAKHLATTQASPAATAQDISKIMGHYLFAAANFVGKHNALADLCDTKALLKANTLPDAATLKKQASALMNKHLGHTKPRARKILHQQVMKTALTLQKNFFLYPKGSKSNKLLGDRFVNAYGSDWYKQSLSLILSNGSRNACLSAYNLMGVHRGADQVCRR